MFFKEKTVQKVELFFDMDYLQQEMNVLKTMYEKQEKDYKRYK